jgi:hypothetical protein
MSSRGVRAVGLAVDPVTGGYWILKSSGGVDAFRAPWRGSLAGKLRPGTSVSAIVASRSGGYRILTAPGGAVPRGLGGRQWDVIPTSRKVVATNHPDFTTISDPRIGQELTAAPTRIESVTGLDTWPWFRFPYGDHNARTVRAVNSLGYMPIGWTVDTLGWMGRSGGITVRQIVRRVLAHRRPGEIVLMHGGSDSGDGSTLDADALPTVIRKLRADGYSFVTIDVLKGFGAVARKADRAVACFGAWSSGSDSGRLRAGVTAVGLAADPATGGYWILKSTGGVDNFHAPWRGSLVGKLRLGATMTAIAAGLPGGYLVLSSDGAVHAFGTPWYGSDAGRLR